MRRYVWFAVAGLGASVVIAWLALWLASDPVPDGVPGPPADALARRVQAAVALPAWGATGAVRWTFSGRHEHLWDRQRGYHFVRWEDREVLFDLSSRKGCAFQEGVPVRGAALRELLEDGYAKWVNDAFWLNPIEKFFDPGVVRKVVTWQGDSALLIQFTQSGLTPGDSYLFRLDSRLRPYAWHMWTFIPVGGLRLSWEGWTKLKTGAWVSTRHRALGFTLELSNVEGAHSLAELVDSESDPFARCEVLGAAAD